MKYVYEEHHQKGPRGETEESDSWPMGNLRLVMLAGKEEPTLKNEK